MSDINQPLTIAVLAGTVRPGRQSFAAAQYVAGQGRKLADVEIVFVDPAELTLPLDGRDDEQRDPRYTEISARADAFFIVTPEYNHSYPGSLKRMLDSEYENYHRKPVAIAGASDGPWGGTRAVEALLPVMRSLGLAPIRQTVYFTHVDKLFDESGNIDSTQQERYDRSIAGTYRELVWMAHALRTARQRDGAGA